MANVFNPPPGWPIEPGFVPPSDWHPDPEWPPAPARWQFWISEKAEPRRGKLLGAVAVMVAIAASAAAVIMLTRTHTNPASNTTGSSGGHEEPIISSSPAPAQIIPPAPAPPLITDADAHGFVVFGDGARCTGGDNAEMFMRTAQSVLVVCRSLTGQLYYRGYRISDSATIELHEVITHPGGFVAVNAPDNARYVITADGFQLIQNGAIVVSEPAVEGGPPGWADKLP